LTYVYDPKASQGAVAALLAALAREGIELSDLQTTQSSLEDIFVSLLQEEQP
jgi:ABC-2 type transport system ATP-binding protein